jgi:alkylglycerol monooxygenase
MNYVTVAIPFFILAMILEYVYGRVRRQQTYRLNDTVNSLTMGSLSRLKSVLALSFSGVVFSSVVSFLGVEPLATENLWIWVVAFIAYDFCYYWKHRMGHEWRILWAAHVAHHQSEKYNLSTALRQTGTDYIGFVFYLPLYIAGVPLEVVITVGSLNLIYQFWVHTEHVGKLGPLEWLLITPSNHRVHHARNPDYLDKNYGGVFIIWDRLFGTYQEELSDQPCVYGISRGLNSWNPIWANVHVWYETALISLRTARLRDKILVWFRGPGWYPADQTPSDQPDWRKPSFDPEMSRFTGAYCFVQYWLLTGMGLAMLGYQASLPRELVLMMFFWFCYSFFALGRLMEQEGQGRKHEWLRQIMLLPLIGFAVYTSVDQVLILVPAGIGVLSLIAFAFGREQDQRRNASPSL